MIINFRDAKLKQQIEKFQATGKIPEYIYAGEIPGFSNDLSRLATLLFLNEAMVENSRLFGEFLTEKARFKLPYIMSKYRKDMNPIAALYQELQLALFKDKKHRNKFEHWIIEYCKENKTEIINALEHDINIIDVYLLKYTNAPLIDNSLLNELLENFNNYLYAFRIL